MASYEGRNMLRSWRAQNKSIFTDYCERGFLSCDLITQDYRNNYMNYNVPVKHSPAEMWHSPDFWDWRGTAGQWAGWPGAPSAAEQYKMTTR
jgi:hypothetical protein